MKNPELLVLTCLIILIALSKNIVTLCVFFSEMCNDISATLFDSKGLELLPFISQKIYQFPFPLPFQLLCTHTITIRARLFKFKFQYS